ncbi:MAG TPA: ABC transporter ATP-binding protein [Anaerolineae bacterium]|nr:ABC transporter ATP-binding protein [Anaerolineae bacterium]
MAKNAIVMDKLTKDFESVRALDNLSLEVPEGIVFGFLGPNGAGKTTTIRLMMGLLEPTSGHVEVLGYKAQNESHRVRAQAGALLEHCGIYEQMSAEDNLEFYGRAFRMPVAERRLRIQELLTHLGLWERRKDSAGSWSRGMKQKLALARALLHRPRLLLLDEPTAGLDVRAAVAIREDLESLAAHEHVTIFLTTHNMTDTERLCQQVAIIRDGSLVAHGTPHELQAMVGSPRVEITGRGFTKAAIELLSAHPNVDGVIRQNNHLAIDLVAGTDVAALVSCLVDAGVHVEEVRRGQPGMEEVFLALTGGKDD